MDKELVMKKYKFCDLFELMPYCNEARQVGPNQLVFNVEDQELAARDGIQKVDNGPDLAGGVYYFSFEFNNERYEYIGESSISIFSRLASHILKLVFRVPNPIFRRCIEENHGALTQNQIQEMFRKLVFKDQFSIASFILDGTFAMKDEMLNLGKSIAKKYRTIDEQRNFAASIEVGIWECSQCDSKELTSAMTRLVESYFLRLYFTKNLRLPLLNLDDDQNEQIANRRLDNVMNLYDASPNDPAIDSIIEKITKTFK